MLCLKHVELEIPDSSLISFERTHKKRVRMFIKLLIIFIIVPITELYVLIEAGSQIGIVPTIALIFLTGMAGAFLARSQGFQILGRIQNDLNAGKLPTEELFDGAIILAGGLLLLTPGFVTDLIGFCLLTPVTRNLLKVGLKRWLGGMIERGEIKLDRR